MADANANKPGRGRKPRPVKAPVTETAAIVVEAAKASLAAGAHAAHEAAPVQPASAAPAEEPVHPPLAAEPAEAPMPAAVEPVLKIEAVEVPLAPRNAPAANTHVEANHYVQSGARSMTETITNTVNQAQQTAQQAGEQFRGAMNQANERGQQAMEKSARVIEEMTDLARGNMEAFVASSKTAAKYVETLTQGAADYNRRSFEQASATLRSFAEVKSPTDFFRLQSDFARSAFDQMVAESARVSETVVKMTGDVAEPITSRYSVAAERLKTVAA